MSQGLKQAEHIPVMAAQVLEGLQLRSAGCYVDATYGRGGHAGQILDALDADGRLYALDRDPEAVARAESQHGDDARFQIAHRAFEHLREQCQAWGVAGRVDGLFMDLGVSSPQLDQAERGFSFRHDGPLDMRMDNSQGETAAQWLQRAEEREIRDVLRRFGEEKAAGRIARRIVERRAESPLQTTRELAELVAGEVRSRQPGKDPATRTFQALRIKINGELEQLEQILSDSLDVLAPGGRLVVLSFHSLEDRMVKRFMQHHARRNERIAGTPEVVSVVPKLNIVARKLRATEAELAENPRARSATLRVAEKCAA